MIMKKFFCMIFLIASAAATQAQQKQDTVVIELAKTSRVVFTMRDKSDIEILKHYNFDELFQEILKKLEARDTTNTIARNDSAQSETVVVPSQPEEDWSVSSNDDDDDDDDDNYRRRGHTEQ